MLGVFRAVPIVFFVFHFFTTEAQTSPQATTPCASKSNTSCDDCLKNVTCLWCASTQQCLEYPVRTILPPRSVCPLAEARWGLCWVNFQVLIITMSVVAGVIIIGILVCCFCCCRCDRIGFRSKKEDAKVEHQANARKARQKERRKEMQLRHHEIRQKYGLAEESPYVRFDDD